MNWLKFRDVSECLSVSETLSSACSKLGGPISQTLYEFVKQRSYGQVIDYSFDYSNLPPSSTDDLIYARQIQALFSKQDFIDLGVDKEQVAYENFLACEEKCRLVNDRFMNQPTPNGVVSRVFHTAQRKIADILGDLPPLDSLDFSFGPGATTNVKKTLSHPLVKIESGLSCSRNTIMHMPSFLEEVPGWRNSFITSSGNFRLIPSISKLVFVPKTSKTYRSIGVEPTLNGFFQKGIGSYLKKRLRLHNVDLSDQMKNRSLAKFGSVTDLVSTIDLKNASDTISYMVVLNLLPLPWFNLLESVRSSEITYKGRVFELERFSSMGNSYTFELESLIFYSLLFACELEVFGNFREDLVSVYGDDIICRRETFDLLTEVLDFFGFEVNSSKSFKSGPFRESCGADYFWGSDIRPFYLKTRLNDQILFVMHNWFFRNCEPSLARIALESTYVHNRIFGPDGFGDGHLIGSHSLRKSRKLKRLGYEGGVFDTYTLNPRRSAYLLGRLSECWVYPFYSTYVSDSLSEPDHNVLPGGFKYSKISVYTLGSSIFRKPY